MPKLKPFISRLEDEVFRQRRLLKPRVEEVELSAVYEMFLDLRLLATVDTRLEAKASHKSELPFYFLMTTVSPLFKASMKKAQALKVKLKPAIQSTDHHDDYLTTPDPDLLFPDTKKQLYWMLQFPEPPVIFRDFLRLFSFHWPVFGELVRALLITSLEWTEPTDEETQWLNVLSLYFESKLQSDLGETLAPILQNARLLSNNTVPISKRKTLDFSDLPKFCRENSDFVAAPPGFKTMKAFTAWCEDTWA